MPYYPALAKRNKLVLNLIVGSKVGFRTLGLAIFGTTVLPICFTLKLVSLSFPNTLAANMSPIGKGEFVLNIGGWFNGGVVVAKIIVEIAFEYLFCE